MKLRHLYASLVLFLPAAVLRADSYTFTLTPESGVISGAPGSTVGWGYTLINNSSTDWLVTTGLQAEPVQYATPLSVFDFPDLAPGQRVAQPFSATAYTGAFGLTWNPTVPDEWANYGVIELNAQWWNSDPLIGGTYLTDASVSSVSYFAFTTASNSATPEPSTWLLLISPVLLLPFPNYSPALHLIRWLMGGRRLPM